MPTSRKHHFVQAAHIDQFVNDEGVVWVYSNQGNCFDSSPRGIYFQNDLNSYETPEGLDSQFEDLVTSFEKDTFPAIARTAKQGGLAEEDIAAVTAYLALSKVRNPSLQRGVIDWYKNSVTSFAKISDQHGEYDEIGDFPGHSGKSITQLLDEGIVEFDINNSVYLDKIFGMTQNTHRVLYLRFKWSLVRSPRNRVVISDHPFTHVHPGEHFGVYGIPMGGDECEVAFPLSSEYYLLGLWGRQVKDIESEDVIDELNKRQAIFANRHLAASAQNRNYGELIMRYRSHGFRTRADVVEAPDGHYHMIAGGVFPLNDHKKVKGEHPLTRTKSVTRIAKFSTD